MGKVIPMTSRDSSSRLAMPGRVQFDELRSRGFAEGGIQASGKTKVSEATGINHRTLAKVECKELITTPVAHHRGGHRQTLG
jgi:hypothetical protein